MQKRLLVTVGSQQGNIATMQRRVLQEAKSMFDGADLEHMHHIGYADLLKLGRLAAPDVQELADWCYKILSINPNFSASAVHVFDGCHCAFLSHDTVWRCCLHCSTIAGCRGAPGRFKGRVQESWSISWFSVFLFKVVGPMFLHLRVLK